MPGALKLEHVELHTEDFDDALSFYTRVFGMTEIDRLDETIYLGCGMDENYDIALREGSTGIEHFAIRVPDHATIKEYRTRLTNHDIDFERTDDAEPNQLHGLRFTLPSGIPMELVTVENDGYHHSDAAALPDRGDLAPLDLHHLNLLSPDVQTDAKFMATHLDFAVSEVRGTQSDWDTAWLRRGDMHHDVGLVSDDPTVSHGSLHHVALEMSGVDHMIRFIDTLAHHGIELELGPGRHVAGNNLFAYFWAPGGHRFELAAEMASIDTDVTHYSEPPTSAWGTPVPETFYSAGSGLASSIH